MRQPPQDPLSNEPNQRQCFSINKLMSRCLHFSKMKSEIRLRAETGQKKRMKTFGIAGKIWPILGSWKGGWKKGKSK